MSTARSTFSEGGGAGWVLRCIGKPRETEAKPAVRHVVELERGATWSAGIGCGVERAVICRAGRVWVTREGDRRDYFLRTGERVTLCGPGRVVVEAMEPSAVEWA